MAIKNQKEHIEKYFGILKKSEEEVREWQEAIKQRRKEINQKFEEKAKHFRRILHGSP